MAAKQVDLDWESKEEGEEYEETAMSHGEIVLFVTRAIAKSEERVWMRQFSDMCEEAQIEVRIERATRDSIDSANSSDIMGALFLDDVLYHRTPLVPDRLATQRDLNGINPRLCRLTQVAFPRTLHLSHIHCSALIHLILRIIDDVVKSHFLHDQKKIKTTTTKTKKKKLAITITGVDLQHELPPEFAQDMAAACDAHFAVTHSLAYSMSLDDAGSSSSSSPIVTGRHHRGLLLESKDFSPVMVDLASSALFPLVSENKTGERKQTKIEEDVEKMEAPTPPTPTTQTQTLTVVNGNEMLTSEAVMEELIRRAKQVRSLSDQASIACNRVWSVGRDDFGCPVGSSGEYRYCPNTQQHLIREDLEAFVAEAKRNNKGEGGALVLPLATEKRFIYAGQRCIVRRSLDLYMRSRGYVCKYAGSDWDKGLEEDIFRAHGGITSYSPEIGFDCCHGGDVQSASLLKSICPSLPTLWNSMGQQMLHIDERPSGAKFPSLRYLEASTKELALQVAAFDYIFAAKVVLLQRRIRAFLHHRHERELNFLHATFL